MYRDCLELERVRLRCRHIGQRLNSFKMLHIDLPVQYTPLRLQHQRVWPLDNLRKKRLMVPQNNASDRDVYLCLVQSAGGTFDNY